MNLNLIKKLFLYSILALIIFMALLTLTETYKSPYTKHSNLLKEVQLFDTARQNLNYEYYPHIYSELTRKAGLANFDIADNYKSDYKDYLYQANWCMQEASMGYYYQNKYNYSYVLALRDSGYTNHLLAKQDKKNQSEKRYYHLKKARFYYEKTLSFLDFDFYSTENINLKGALSDVYSSMYEIDKRPENIDKAISLREEILHDYSNKEKHQKILNQINMKYGDFKDETEFINYYKSSKKELERLRKQKIKIKN